MAYTKKITGYNPISVEYAEKTGVGIIEAGMMYKFFKVTARRLFRFIKKNYLVNLENLEIKINTRNISNDVNMNIMFKNIMYVIIEVLDSFNENKNILVKNFNSINEDEFIKRASKMFFNRIIKNVTSKLIEELKRLVSLENMNKMLNS